MANQLKITVIATGFEGHRKPEEAARSFEERFEEKSKEEEEKYEIPTFLRKK